MNRKNRLEKGQILVIYALAIVGVLAMAALLLDGGQTYLSRRTAQMAADSAAIAGTHDLCYESSGLTDSARIDHIKATVLQYASTENNVLLEKDPDIVLNPYTHMGTVTVYTLIHQKSFLAQLIGRPTIDVTAQAKAGCFPPGSAKNILPVAWSCKPSVSGGNDCDNRTLDWSTELEPLLDVYDLTDKNLFTTIDDANEELLKDYMYIAMDTDKTEAEFCGPPFGTGTVVCDFNGDGISDVKGSGNRSWLDLSGAGGGASDMSGWIENGYPAFLSIHTWLEGQTGAISSVFGSVHEFRQGTVVFLPVFNQMCDEGKDYLVPGNACYDLAHVSPYEDDSHENTSIASNMGMSFHIISFATFYISCVEAPGGNGEANCPGSQYANIPNSVKTIEGFFVTGYPESDVAGTGGADTGVYIISLIE